MKMRLMSFEPSGEILKLEKNIGKSVVNAFNKPKMNAMLHGKPRNYRMVSISVIFRLSRVVRHQTDYSRLSDQTFSSPISNLGLNFRPYF